MSITDNQLKICMKIRNDVNNKKNLNLKKIADLININPYHKDFRKVITLLITEKIVDYIETIGTCKIIKINHKKLEKFIWEEDNTINKQYYYKNHTLIY